LGIWQKNQGGDNPDANQPFAPSIKGHDDRLLDNSMGYWHTFKRTISYIPGTVPLYEFVMGLRKPNEVPRYRLSRGPMPCPDILGLEKQYRKSPLSKQADSFVLYRIIGNDLVPRHRKGQSRDNLRFILENEPDFPNCEKRFVINRIVDSKEEEEIIGLLEEAGYAYLRIPFRLEEYRKLAWDVQGVPLKYAPFTRRFSTLSPAEQLRLLMRVYRYKNNYVMNNNGARNAALTEGRHLAKWVLPWDGNCFITQKAWQKISEAICSYPTFPILSCP